MRLKLALIGFTFVLVGAVPAVPALAGGGGHGCMEPVTDGSGTEVTLDANCFAPTVVRVEPGTTVTWTNKEVALHTVTGSGLSFGNFDEIRKGESVSATFDSEGIFPYFCAFHPGMVGAVAVSEAASEKGAAGSAGGAAGEPAGGSVGDPAAVSEPLSDGGSQWLIPVAIGALIIGLAFVASIRLRTRRAHEPA